METCWWLAGSIPGTLPGDLYEQIMDMLSDRRVEVIVDATRELLQNVLKHRPFLIKPNHHELGEIYGVTVKDAEEAVVYAHRLQEEGARNVLVSMAGDGAVLLTQEGAVYRLKRRQEPSETPWEPEIPWWRDLSRDI